MDKVPHIAWFDAHQDPPETIEANGLVLAEIRKDQWVIYDGYFDRGQFFDSLCDKVHPDLWAYQPKIVIEPGQELSEASNG